MHQCPRLNTAALARSSASITSGQAAVTLSLLKLVGIGNSPHPERVTVGPAAVLLLQVNDMIEITRRGRPAARIAQWYRDPIVLQVYYNLAGYVATRIEGSMWPRDVPPAVQLDRATDELL